MPKVLKINNENKFDDFVIKFNNSVLIPINDGDGNLILPVEVLQDSNFISIHDLIIQSTTEIDYIPFPEDEIELNNKLQQLEQTNKLIKVDFITEEIEHNGKKVKIKKNQQTVVAEQSLITKIGNTFRSIGQFITNIFK